MSSRRFGLALCAALFLFAILTQAQSAPQFGGAANMQLAQTMGQAGPSEAASNAPKAKIKKAKRKSNRNGNAERPSAAPPNAGQPDPGKYQ